jgi:DNA-binding MarR family transcriptional regulator
MSPAEETSPLQRLPDRVLALPMYLMLALTREGYRHGVRSQVELRMPHYVVLAVLEDSGPCSQKSIAECIGFDKSDVTKLMNELEDRGLVRRVDDPEDHRRHRVTLTAKGKHQLEASDRELNGSMRTFLSALSAVEYRQLQQLLLKALRAHDARFDNSE